VTILCTGRIQRMASISVKSVCNLAQSCSLFLTRSFRGRGVSYVSVNEETQWKAIWKINAPIKIKIHLWRFAHNCLPSGAQMQRRHIPTSDTCILCGRDETIEHSLLLCQFAR
jgi:hypothetical protein